MSDGASPRVASEVFAKYTLLNSASSCGHSGPPALNNGWPSQCDDTIGQTRDVTTLGNSSRVSNDDCE